MRFTTLDQLPIRPGQLVEFVPRAFRMEPSSVPPSFNQRFHLDTAHRGTGTPNHWLACAFDLPGPVDLPALHHAISTLLRRHNTLRSGFRPRPGGPARFVADRIDLVTHQESPAEDPRVVLARRLAVTCRPLSWPSSLFTVVIHPTGGTVFCGFDHRDVDGYSLALIVHELRATYRDPTRVLPPVGGFVDYCAWEHTRSIPLDQRASAVTRWRSFLAASGGRTPRFPLPLGGGTGPARARTADQRLLDAPTTEAFARTCRSAQAGVLSGLLAALGLATRALGGDEVFRVCVPLHTRHDARWERAVGWFITTIPVTFPIRSTFRATLDEARAGFRAALADSAVPLSEVLARCDFRRDRDDVFMLSYVDYRRLPGAHQHRASRAYHLSAVTLADNVQLWAYRTADGLFLRSRYPATPAAGHAVASVTHILGEIISGTREE